MEFCECIQKDRLKYEDLCSTCSNAVDEYLRSLKKHFSEFFGCKLKIPEHIRDETKNKKNTISKLNALVSDDKYVIDNKEFFEIYTHNSKYIHIQEFKKAKTKELYCYNKYINILENYCLINQSFHIWTNKNFGYINAARLGRKNINTIDLEEINTALADLSYLVLFIKNNVSTNMDYKIDLAGTRTEIVLPDHTRLPLYLLDGLFSTYYFAPKFNQAIIIVLKTLHNSAELLSTNSETKLPFPINSEGYISNYCVLVEAKNNEEWTTAMKLLLIDMKWIIGSILKKKNDRNN